MTAPKAMDIANDFISRYGADLYLTNLKLNKLVYYTQVESLRETGKPLFTDTVEAWDYGPVEPEVYRSFKLFGDGHIQTPLGAYTTDTYVNRIVDTVVEKFHPVAHEDKVPVMGWQKIEIQGDGSRNKPISIKTILSSQDVKEYPQLKGPLAQSADTVNKQFANALKLLEDA